MIEIDYNKLGNIAEKRNRRFIVECRQGMFNTKRIFEYKKDLRRFIEKPHISDVRITLEET